MSSGYILGYSGLDGYVAYKNKAIQGLSHHESLVGQGMDAAAALMKDGVIIAAAAEERFTGKKHTGDFPVQSIQTCLEMANITIKEVASIAHNFNYEPYRDLLQLNGYTSSLYETVLSDRSQIALFKRHFNVDVSERFTAVDHHESHARYAFDTSGFSSALVVVADGLGEFSSISIYESRGENKLSLLKTYGPESSLGMLYSAITDYLGFLTNSDEYKIMGLAAYGNPQTYKDLFEEIVRLGEDGEIIINHLLPASIKSPLERETYRYFKDWLDGRIFSERSEDEPVESGHKDLAAALQCKLNEAILHLVGYWQQKTNHPNLVMAGGVALNCVANASIAESRLFEKFYVAPASADDGTALGAALVVSNSQFGPLNQKHYLDMPFYGPSVKLDSRNREVASAHLKIESLEDDALIDTVASAIAEGKIVAWAQGGMEYGPRALGHRSILADPRHYEMRDRLNTVTKQRENFRPFAPLVKEEALHRYFNAVEGVVYKHMLVNVEVGADYRPHLQAVTHVDGTARVQTVSKRDLPILWRLLDRFESLTTLPVILNTSFNLKSMPIVCSDKDAIEAFVNSDIDLLVINNDLIRKEA